jgi:hypothetical protein
MKKWLLVATLTIGVVTVAATLLVEPIASAAQTVSATTIGPLDGQGNVAVHEQGTAAVKAAEPLPVQDPAATRTPAHVTVEVHIADGQGHFSQVISVPERKRLLVGYVSGRLFTPATDVDTASLVTDAFALGAPPGTTSTGIQFFPTTVQHGDTLNVVTFGLETHILTLAGTDIRLDVDRAAFGSGQVDGQVTIEGELIDMP